MPTMNFANFGSSKNNIKEAAIMKKEKNTRWLKVRSLLNTIHLWLGVGSGLILFVVCLSGTVYTFSTEIQKITDAELYTVKTTAGSKRVPAATLIDEVQRLHGPGVVQTVVIPEADNGSYQVTLLIPEAQPADGAAPKGGQGGGKRVMFFIDPYAGKVLGTNETNSSAFFGIMFRLHRWLLLDTAVGRPIVGVATMIFVVIIITGLVIWFPKKLKNWRQGLRIKTSGNWKRMNHDLHNALGLYASLFLLVMALTGLTWSFGWYKKAVTNAFGGGQRQEQKPLQSTFVQGATPSLETYQSAADNVLPYGGDYRFSLPTDSLGVVSVSKTKNTFFATSVADRLTLDQYSAAVLKTELFSEKPFNEKVLSSMKAIHIGSFYGTFSKIIYFMACLIGTSLPVTGVIIWINKLRKKKKNPKASQEIEDEQSVAA